MVDEPFSYLFTIWSPHKRDFLAIQICEFDVPASISAELILSIARAFQKAQSFAKQNRNQ